MKYELGFIGAGNMAEAIARAAIDRNIVAPSKMIAADPAGPRQQVFGQLGVTICQGNAEVIAQSSHVLLAIKPQTLVAIGPQLKNVDVESQIVISIMAGVSTAKIESSIGRPARIVRIMPNTPLMAGCGMAGIALGKSAKSGDESLAVRLFNAAGKATIVDEADMDAITAVSGSGPAYLFYLAEAMERAAAEIGLAEHASLLVGQTLLGAATLLCESGESPQELRAKVTSPGGTTEAAVKHLDGNSTLEVFVNAIKAARDRSVDLGA